MRLEAFLSLVSHAVLSLYVTSVERSVHLLYHDNGKEENLFHDMCYARLLVCLEKLCVFGIMYARTLIQVMGKETLRHILILVSYYISSCILHIDYISSCIFVNMLFCMFR